MELSGRLAIVTGAGRGIGRAIALELAQAGASLVLLARTGPELRAVVEEIRGKGGKAVELACDVSDSKQVDSAVAHVLERYGAIHILINNAGAFDKRPVVPLPGVDLGPPLTPEPVIGPMSDEAWRRMFSVNVDSAFFFARAVGPSMLARRSGVVINVSSNSASQAARYVSAYNCSKAALSMLTRVLALEWADYGIRVNAVAPGEYHTQLTDFSWSNATEKAKRLARIPMHREGDLGEVGFLVRSLCDDRASYITGQVFHIDGGLTA